MKTFSRFLLFLSAWLATSCVFDVDDAEPSGDGICFSVDIDGSPSRSSSFQAVEGYEFVCFMQVADNEGNIISTSDVLRVSVDKIQFTVTGSQIDKERAAKALFWAEYRPTDAGRQKMYNTDNLLNVRYNKTNFDIASTADIKACDAFAASYEIIREKTPKTARVILQRPVSLVRFKPSNPEAFSKAASLTVKFDTYSGFDISLKSWSSNTPITLSNSSLKSSRNYWFEAFVLVPEGISRLGFPVEIALAGDGMEDYKTTVKANALPIYCNRVYNVTGNLGEASSSDLVFDVSINGDWEVSAGTDFEIGGGDLEQPDELSVPLALGVMVDRQGRGTSDASKAVGTVVIMEPFVDPTYIDPRTDAVADYDSKFAGKTIKAYVLSLAGISTSGGANVPLSIGGEYDWSDFSVAKRPNGSLMTQPLLDKLAGSQFAVEFNSWKAANAISGENITDWYIPSEGQLATWLYDIEQGLVTAPAGSGALYSKEAICPQGQGRFYISSTAPNAGNGAKVWKITNEGGTLKQTSTTTSSTRPADLVVDKVICYPMFTIFE